ncbi:MAG: endonuclease G [Crocinitomix sp.]|jgi:endonuclease G
MKEKVSSEDLKNLVRGKAARFLDETNITSVGIGYKRKGSKFSKEISIQYTVGQKVALEQLETVKSKEIPQFFEINGVKIPTDVIERDYVTTLIEVKELEKVNRKKRIDPIYPGTSIGHPDISAGTAGCVVYDANSGEKYLLSNWHVLHGNTGKIGDPIIQPGSFDDRRVDQNKVGVLVNSHLGLAGDCAIAKITNRKLNAELLDLKGAVVKKLAEPELGDTVVKSGRTTGVTYGVVSRVHVTVSIRYGTHGIHKIGGFEYSPDPNYPAKNGEISMGGDSGSAVMYAKKGKATDMILGVHFAGETGNAPEHGLACYATSVFKKLNISPQPPNEEKIIQSRQGFDHFFLGKQVRPPYPASNQILEELLIVDEKRVIHYTHFSLVMNKTRKLAAWSAWNIDGERMVKVNGNSRFFKRDPKIPKEAQIGNELYKSNPLDRGHIARRAELCWGTRIEAERANKESYYYTNIAPQHERLNRSTMAGIWGELENAVFKQARIKDLRMNVMAGPVFKRTDPKYRGEQIPKDFWKVISYFDEETEDLIHHAFILSQSDLIDGLEALDFDEFQVYKVTLDKITEETGFVFTDLENARIEPLDNSVDVRLINSLNEVI